MIRMFVNLVRRELWENRSMLVVPCALVFAQVVIILVKTPQIQQAVTSLADTSDTAENLGIPSLVRSFNLESWHRAILLANSSMFVIMMGVMIVMVYFYCIYALNREYHDRSILFWKSLPISDTKIIASKVLTIFSLIVGIGIIQLLALTIQLALEILLVIPADQKMNFLSGLVTSLPTTFIINLLAGIYLFLYALPYFAWALLVSAWTKSSPFVYAIVFPLIITSMVSMVIRKNIIPNFISPFAALAQPFTKNTDLAGNIMLEARSHSIELLSATPLWVGVVLGFILIVLTVIVRGKKRI